MDVQLQLGIKHACLQMENAQMVSSSRAKSAMRYHVAALVKSHASTRKPTRFVTTKQLSQVRMEQCVLRNLAMMTERYHVVVRAHCQILQFCLWSAFQDARQVDSVPSIAQRCEGI